MRELARRYVTLLLSVAAGGASSAAVLVVGRWLVGVIFGPLSSETLGAFHLLSILLVVLLSVGAFFAGVYYVKRLRGG